MAGVSFHPGPSTTSLPHYEAMPRSYALPHGTHCLRCHPCALIEKMISPWHEIPLYAADGNLHYICEIPKV
jgi:hypothetical protein